MSKKKNSKKIPGEINLTVIELGLDCRKYLQWYYAVEGIGFDFFEMDGSYIKGREDHIWIFDKEPFIKAGIKVKDCVSFTGKAYAYKRHDNSIDFSIKECEDIQKIDQYSLPDKEELKMQSLERLVCDMCMYNEHCYGFCIAPDGGKESMIAFFNSKT